MHRSTVSLAAALVVACFAPATLPARELSVEQRIAAQRAIERVYWKHREWPFLNPGPKPAFDALFPEAALRDRVEDYLRKTNALEVYWGRAITAEQLQAETERMARRTRAPDTLREIFAALGDDPYVIAETLARQRLVDRLIHNYYAHDERFHGETPKQTFEEWWGETRATIDSQIEGQHPAYAPVEISGSGNGCTDDSWRALPSSGPSARDSHTAVWTGAEMIVWGGAVTQSEITTNNGGRYDPATDTWVPTSTVGAPPGRQRHVAVWTGTEMVVWGGFDGAPVGTGGRYNP
ncbi:MAG: hypothetical protein R3344_00070, partial [Acidobacteriota bacterium]|nr:hypothetical protein [Acidobacteriota bacterium]